MDSFEGTRDSLEASTAQLLQHAERVRHVGHVVHGSIRGEVGGDEALHRLAQVYVCKALPQHRHHERMVACAGYVAGSARVMSRDCLRSRGAQQLPVAVLDAGLNRLESLHARGVTELEHDCHRRGQPGLSIGLEGRRQRHVLWQLALAAQAGHMQWRHAVDVLLARRIVHAADYQQARQRAEDTARVRTRSEQACDQLGVVGAVCECEWSVSFGVCCVHVCAPLNQGERRSSRADARRVCKGWWFAELDVCSSIE